jgi:hypothetical protein
MTSKIKAVLAAAVLGAVGFINWLCTIPPSQQADLLGQLVQIVPVSWRPNMGVATRLLMWVAVVYGAHQASKSGPQTPPTNKPT